jgi:hypothetical protein
MPFNSNNVKKHAMGYGLSNKLKLKSPGDFSEGL